MDGRDLRCLFAVSDILAGPPPGGPFQFGLYSLDPKTGSVRHYAHNSNDPSSLSTNQVIIKRRRPVFGLRRQDIGGDTGELRRPSSPAGKDIGPIVC